MISKQVINWDTNAEKRNPIKCLGVQYISFSGKPHKLQNGYIYMQYFDM